MQWAGMDENTPIEHPIVSRAMTNAQVQTEGHNFDMRKHLVEYDDVINEHRREIYRRRSEILGGADLKADVLSMVKDEIQHVLSPESMHRLIERQTKNHVYEQLVWNKNRSSHQNLLNSLSSWFSVPEGLRAEIQSGLAAEEVAERLVEYAISLFREWEPAVDNQIRQFVEQVVMKSLVHDHLTDSIIETPHRTITVRGVFTDLPQRFSPSVLSRQPLDQSISELIHHAEDLYEQLERNVGADNMRKHERAIMRWAIDRSWMNHLTEMDRLRLGIGLRAVGQEQPLVVYKREAYASFGALRDSIQRDVARTVYHIGVAKEAQPQKKEAVPVGRKVGRNDPCPCGSGKKHKHCCGK